MSPRLTARPRTSAPTERPQPSATAAVRFLAQQADPFLRAGLRESERGPDWLTLTGDDVTITLRWRTQRLLLARIHQLQVTADVDAAARGVASGQASGESRLRFVGRGGARRFRWQSRRGRPPTGLDGPAVTELARAVDLTRCTITPRRGGWRICVEPYAGSRLRVFFPPIHYVTTLRQGEAATIVAALHELAAAANGRPAQGFTAGSATPPLY